MKRTDPTVSVIVPIYKVEEYLQECIDSICMQTYSKLEIILIDDGSPDQCGAICDQNAAKDSRIIVIHKENGGLSSARNAGIDVAGGEYIAFIDADDTIHPDFIRILLGLCKQYNCDISQCDFLSVKKESLKLPLNPIQSIHIYNNKQAMNQLSYIKSSVKYAIAWNKLYKKHLFESIRYPLGKIHEDEFTTYLLLWKANKIAVTNQYLYYYMQREESITGKPFSIKRLDAVEAYKERLDFFKRNHLQQEYLGTLQMLFNLIENDYRLLKKSTDNCDDLCNELWREMEKIRRMLDDSLMLKNLDSRDCIYPCNSRIVLYGAGYWGCNYFKRISERQPGVIVGWVDNSWYELKHIDYPIMPIDTLLCMEYDYILITIKSRLVQEEVAENLKSWGIPEQKILFISEE